MLRDQHETSADLRVGSLTIRGWLRYLLAVLLVVASTDWPLFNLFAYHLVMFYCWRW
jgi:hypothetical protein